MAMPILWCQVEPVVRLKRIWIILIAIISLGLYIWLAFIYPLGPSLEDPRASWATLVDPNLLTAARHLAIYLLLTLLYLAAIYLFSPQNGPIPIPYKRQLLIIVVVWLACSIALMFVSPSGESHDIFDYVFRGRMMVEYQANPLVEIPDSFDITTPFSRYFAWRYNVDTYGPIWEGFSAAVSASIHQLTSWIGWWNESTPGCPDSPESCRLLISYLTGYRLLAIILTGLSGWVILNITKRFNPEYAPMALVAWLWCPLVLISSALGAHNDALMIFLLLLSVWLLQLQRPLWALIMLLLAAHVKLTVVIWLPIFIVWVLWRYGWKRTLIVMLEGCVMGVVLSWLLYLPFGGWQTLPRMLHERLAFLANSPWRVLNDLLTKSWGWSADTAHKLTTQLPTLLFGVFVLAFLLGFFFYHNKSNLKSVSPIGADRLLWFAMTVVSLLYLLVGSYWLQPWYFLWAIFPAVLIPTSQFTRWIIPWLGFGALASNVVVDFVTNASSEPLNFLFKDTLPLAVIWGPVLIITVIILLRYKLGKSQVLKQA
jgi:hypothetical protein